MVAVVLLLLRKGSASVELAASAAASIEAVFGPPLVHWKPEPEPTPITQQPQSQRLSRRRMSPGPRRRQKQQHPNRPSPKSRRFKLRISNAALRTVDHRGGLDAFLMRAKEAELSPKALKIKREIEKAQASA